MLKLVSRRSGPGVQGWRVVLWENLLTLWWRLLETMLVHWVSEPKRRKFRRTMILLFVLKVSAFLKNISVQVFLWKVHLRPRLNVTTRVTGPVTYATGPQSLGSMLCMCSATMRTSSTLPSWLRLSPHQTKTFTQTRFAPTTQRAPPCCLAAKKYSFQTGISFDITICKPQVKAYGPGLQSSGLAVGKPTEFTVDAKQGGKAPLKIVAQVGLSY